jgi:hypothetical protein
MPVRNGRPLLKGVRMSDKVLLPAGRYRCAVTKASVFFVAEVDGDGDECESPMFGIDLQVVGGKFDGATLERGWDIEREFMAILHFCLPPESDSPLGWCDIVVGIFDDIDGPCSYVRKVFNFTPRLFDGPQLGDGEFAEAF